MKILFINTSDKKGGAAIAAWRLGQELSRSYQTENHFLVASKSSNDPQVIPTRTGFTKSTEKSINRVTSALGLQYLWLPFSARKMLSFAKDLQPDIISLHNTHGGYFQTSLLKPLSQIAPIVWTFHDMWPITRNAAHTFGNENWKKMQTFPEEKKIYPRIGIDTGNLLLRYKTRIYQESDFEVVTPSRWLYNFAQQSPLLEGKNVHLIPHGIDMHLFKPRKDHSRLYDKHSIPEEQLILLFAAHLIGNNPWKGGQLLLDILGNLDKQLEQKITVLILGQKRAPINKTFTRLDLTYTGYVDPKQMPEYYSFADVFILPSRAESFGLVLLEATACGTPAVTFDVCSCGEIIKDAHNGFLVEPFDTQSFAHKVYRLLSDTQLRQKMGTAGVKIAQDNFSLRRMSDKYFDLSSQLSDDKS